MTEVVAGPCNCPTITYPNGNEELLDRELVVSWHAPKTKHPQDFPVYYELFFTDSYRGDETNWLHVATVPSTEQSFALMIPTTVASGRCRVGIRCRDHRGSRSGITVSAGDFRVLRRRLTAPSVLSPVDRGSYRHTVPIILDYAGLRGTIRSERRSKSTIALR
ncbi:MAG: hypothetical protein HC888_01365 [Candidatus Competibacteraceae bacterium]|nr:hypothetical protein [Candidatus Competibacteraceae bacterium]